MYGAGPAKLGNILGESAASGKKKKVAFFKKYTPYADLTDDLEKAVDNNGGYIKALDGRRLYVRNKKDVLSTCLQGNAAIVFKKWMVEVDKNVTKKYKGSLKQIIAYHDELQFELDTPDLSIAEVFGERIVHQAKLVGEYFKLMVPIDAEAKTGRNWAECH